MPSTVDRSTIHAQFLAIVRSAATATAPVYHAGALPGPAPAPAAQGRFGALGPAGLPVPDINRLPADLDNPATASETSVIRVFYVLHQFACEMTRHRRVRYFYTYGFTTNPTPWRILPGVAALGALPNGMEMVIDPANPPDGGGALPIPAAPNVPPPAHFTLTAGNLNNYLLRLRNSISAIQGSNTFSHNTFTYCHSSCHSSCHGSRGRR